MDDVDDIGVQINIPFTARARASAVQISAVGLS